MTPKSRTTIIIRRRSPSSLLVFGFLLIGLFSACCSDVVNGQVTTRTLDDADAEAAVLWRLASTGTGSDNNAAAFTETTATGDHGMSSTTLVVDNSDVSFTNFVVPPPEFNADHIGFALTRSPVGFQLVQLNSGEPGTFFDIEQHVPSLDLAIDAFVYSPATEIFVFLIGSQLGPGYGRLAAYTSSGTALWTLANDDTLDDTNSSSPLPGWTWDPSVVTPILSHDNTTVYINFVSDAVTIAAFRIEDGSIDWNITSLNADENVMAEDYPMPANAALGGMLLQSESSTIYAGLYEKSTAFHSGSTANFHSGLIEINAQLGTVVPQNSWCYDDTLSLGDYQGGIRGTPVWGTSNLYASDQFWGHLAWSQMNLSSLIYSTELSNDYTSMAMAMSEDKYMLFGVRDSLYPTGFVAHSAIIQWTTKTTGLTCDVQSVDPNPPPIVDGELVYYACGNVWYAFTDQNGTLYRYGNTTAENGLFVSMSIVDGVLYTTENIDESDDGGSRQSAITAWDITRTTQDMVQEMEESTMSPSNDWTTTTPQSSGMISNTILSGRTIMAVMCLGMSLAATIELFCLL